MERVSPPDLAILREQEIRISDDHRRVPDVLAVQAGVVDLDRASYDKESVLLAVEVVSPSTQTG